MDVKLINPFINAAVNVLTTMAATAPDIGQPVVKKDKTTWGCVTGVIGMVGDQVGGNMIISFEKDCILRIVGNMLMEEFTDVNDDVVDAVGELTNMISGGAKKELNEHGMTFDMAQPIMIVGERMELKQLGESPVITVPFRTEGGGFVLEASLASKTK